MRRGNSFLPKAGSARTWEGGRGGLGRGRRSGLGGSQGGSEDDCGVFVRLNAIDLRRLRVFLGR